MTRLISYGDHLEKGQYQVHSRFRRVVNFVSGNQLASVVHPSVGGGPLNVVVEGADLASLKVLNVFDDCFTLNEAVIPFDESSNYLSAIEISGFDERRFRANLEYFDETLMNHSPEKSLTFLLDETRKRFFKTSYEMEFVRRFEAAVKILNENHLPAKHNKNTKKLFSLFRVFRRREKLLSAFRMIKGTGFGLTPSGDDFIAGWLQSLNLVGKICKTDYSVLSECVFQESRNSNVLTNSFLSTAANGWLAEKFRDLINALLYSGKDEIKERTIKVLSHGETSGSDWCVGFLFGIKKRR